MRVSMDVHVRMCACAYEGQKPASGVILQDTVHLVLETGSLTGLEGSDSARLAG